MPTTTISMTAIENNICCCLQLPSDGAMYCRALYDFSSQDAEDLSFTAQSVLRYVLGLRAYASRHPFQRSLC